MVVGLAGPYDEERGGKRHCLLRHIWKDTGGSIQAFSSVVASLRLWEWRLFFPLTYLQTCLSLSSTNPIPIPGHSFPALLAVLTRSTILFLPQPHPETQGCTWQPPTLNSNNSLECLSLAGLEADSAVWVAPSCLSCSREAVVSRMKALHKSQAEPRSPRSIPRALALDLGAQLLKELLSHSPTTGFATGTHWGWSHLVPSFPVPLAYTRSC